MPEKWEQDALTLANGLLAHLEEWQAEAEQASQAEQDATAGDGVMRDYFAGYVGHVFRSKDAWKALALAVRREYGEAMKLLGSASAYLYTFGTYHDAGKGLPERAYQEAIELDEKIQKYAKNANVPIPEILRAELT